ALAVCRVNRGSAGRGETRVRIGGDLLCLGTNTHRRFVGPAWIAAGTALHFCAAISRTWYARFVAGNRRSCGPGVIGHPGDRGGGGASLRGAIGREGGTARLIWIDGERQAKAAQAVALDRSN